MGWKLIKQDFKNWELCTIKDAISQWPQFFSCLLQVRPISEKTKIVRVKELLDIISKDINDGKFPSLKSYAFLVH